MDTRRQRVALERLLIHEQLLVQGVFTPPRAPRDASGADGAAGLACKGCPPPRHARRLRRLRRLRVPPTPPARAAARSQVSRCAPQEAQLRAASQSNELTRLQRLARGRMGAMYAALAVDARAASELAVKLRCNPLAHVNSWPTQSGLQGAGLRCREPCCRGSRGNDLVVVATTGLAGVAATSWLSWLSWQRADGCTKGQWAAWRHGCACLARVRNLPQKPLEQRLASGSTNGRAATFCALAMPTRAY